MTSILYGRIEGTKLRGRPVNTLNKIACNDLGGLRAAYSWYGTISDKTAWRQPLHLPVPSWDLILPICVRNDDVGDDELCDSWSASPYLTAMSLSGAYLWSSMAHQPGCLAPLASNSRYVTLELLMMGKCWSTAPM